MAVGPMMELHAQQSGHARRSHNVGKGGVSNKDDGVVINLPVVSDCKTCRRTELAPLQCHTSCLHNMISMWQMLAIATSGQQVQASRRQHLVSPGSFVPARGA
jgi:hypothetical protein